MGTFEIFRDSIGNFCFQLRTPGGEILFVSDGYATKQGAQRGIDAVKRYAASAVVIDTA